MEEGGAQCPASFGGPVIVVGTDRSGTTLLRLILNCHPSIAIPHESWFLIDLLQAGVHKHELAGAHLAAAIELICAQPRFEEWATTEHDLRVAIAAQAGFESFSAFVEFVFRLEVGDVAIWGDKTPEHLAHVSELATALTNARFIALVRDPRDVGPSLLALRWRGHDVYSVAHYLRRSWRQLVDAASALGPRLLTIRYEDLVLDRQRTTSRICDFLGVDYAPEMDDFTARAVADLAPSEHASGVHENLHRLPRNADVARWRHTNRGQARAFEAWTGVVLREAGYEPAISAARALVERAKTVPPHLGTVTTPARADAADKLEQFTRRNKRRAYLLAKRLGYQRRERCSTRVGQVDQVLSEPRLAGTQGVPVEESSARPTRDAVADDVVVRRAPVLRQAQREPEHGGDTVGVLHHGVEVLGAHAAVVAHVHDDRVGPVHADAVAQRVDGARDVRGPTAVDPARHLSALAGVDHHAPARQRAQLRLGIQEDGVADDEHAAAEQVHRGRILARAHEPDSP